MPQTYQTAKKGYGFWFEGVDERCVYMKSNPSKMHRETYKQIHSPHMRNYMNMICIFFYHNNWYTALFDVMKLMEPFVKLYFAISAHVQGIGKETSLIKFRDVNVILMSQFEIHQEIDQTS